ncbi:MAG: exonuclease SbcCD subunit D [Gemmatimonadota bacterium]
MVRLLHVADVHLGAPLASLGAAGAERARAVLESFTRLPEAAARHEIDAVLIAGDLFDRPDPPDVVAGAALETLRRLAEQGVPVFAVPGNHDTPRGAGTPYDEVPPGVTVFREPSFGDPVTVEAAAGPLHVYGVAYDAASVPEPLGGFRRTDAPGVHAVLLHGSVRDAPHWDRGSALPLPVETLATLDADYIALGDHHRFRPPDGFEGPGLVPACYPGSFAGLDWTETGPRGYVLARVRPGEPPAVELHASDVAPIHDAGRIDVSDLESESEIADRIAAAAGPDAPLIVTLEGEPPFPVDGERLEERLAARFGACRVIDETRFFDSAAVRALARRPTVAGHVADLGIRRIEAAPDAKRAIHDRALRIALRALED